MPAAAERSCVDELPVVRREYVLGMVPLSQLGDAMTIHEFATRQLSAKIEWVRYSAPALVQALGLVLQSRLTPAQDW